MRFKRRTNDYFLSLKDKLTQLDIFLLHSVCSNQWLLVNLWGKKKTLTSCSVHHRSSDPCRVCIHLLGLTALEGSGIKGQWPQGSWGAALACQSDVSRVMAPGRDEPCVLSLILMLSSLRASLLALEGECAWPQMNCFTTSCLWCTSAAIK